ncbi:MAG: type I DNA topoisomerase [Defluviitaleaceae bacterium]|nr:type I DNA topoisomerase [Defluviitaleaceae bacterium]
MNLVIVESPAKAKTLKKFLGKTYKIEASVGHIKDLPKSTLGVDFENDYEPRYITIRGKGEILSKLKKEAKSANKIYLATDPDREGEAISWHLKSALGVDENKVLRVTFNQITKEAVKNAIKQARDINMDLVDAQQARRVLDRVVGYKISPLLWKKVKKGLSAGRVQSVALKVICDREEEIDAFITKEYWSFDADLGANKAKLNAKLHNIDGEEVNIENEEQANELESKIKKEKFIVDEIKKGQRTRKPSAPFTTSTLQQEASKNLNFATSKTMQIAQQLYENGLLTYIRTDSTRIAPEVFPELQNYIEKGYGEEYTPKQIRLYKNKNSSQDAHEAIRPTDVTLAPNSMIETLTRDQIRLYTLIHNRYVSSQMPDAIFDTTAAKIKAGIYNFRANASALNFPGFLIIQKEKIEDTKLPAMESGTELALKQLNKNQHFTQPPPRYNDASLVKLLEERGIGRPSTYASIITTLTARNYITKEDKVFYPTELGEIVNNILKENFSEIVDVEFTSRMESSLDMVEDGDLAWKEVLRGFYPSFSDLVEKAEENIGEIELTEEISDVLCDKCGKNMVVKFGRFGKFLACPGFPECRSTKAFFEEAGVNCPKCDGKVLIKKSKKGRKFFGCENNNVDENESSCDFISWNKPAKKPCPKCNALMVEKGYKKITLACTEQACGYRENLEDEEE